MLRARNHQSKIRAEEQGTVLITWMVSWGLRNVSSYWTTNECETALRLTRMTKQPAFKCHCAHISLPPLVMEVFGSSGFAKPPLAPERFLALGSGSHLWTCRGHSSDLLGPAAPTTQIRQGLLLIWFWQEQRRTLLSSAEACLLNLCTYPSQVL